MDMQEPEKQRLEEEPMDPAEEVNEPSDVPVLSDVDASEPDEEPASIASTDDDATARPDQGPGCQRPA